MNMTSPIVRDAMRRAGQEPDESTYACVEAYDDSIMDRDAVRQAFADVKRTYMQFSAALDDMKQTVNRDDDPRVIGSPVEDMEDRLYEWFNKFQTTVSSYLKRGRIST